MCLLLFIMPQPQNNHTVPLQISEPITPHILAERWIQTFAGSLYTVPSVQHHYSDNRLLPLMLYYYHIDCYLVIESNRTIDSNNVSETFR